MTVPHVFLQITGHEVNSNVLLCFQEVEDV